MGQIKRIIEDKKTINLTKEVQTEIRDEHKETARIRGGKIVSEIAETEADPTKNTIDRIKTPKERIIIEERTHEAQL